MVAQRTIKKAVSSTGIGVHLGQKVHIRLLPAAPNTGIVFRRTDLTPHVDLQVHPDAVGETMFCTTLVSKGVKVSTIEHLMSALCALGIDNLIIELSSHEVPIMDGSSAPFVFLLETAGIAVQSDPRRFIKILSPVEVREGDKWARLIPYAGFRVACSIDYQHPAIPKHVHHAEIDLTKQNYSEAIAKARTYGFLKDYEWLRSKNLALGGSLDNAVVFDEFKILNEHGLRYPDELVRHKILDAIGDLYVLGHPIIGAFEGYKMGHHLNNLLVRTLLATKSAWVLETQPIDVPSVASVPQFDESANQIPAV